jgi:division protein CdvB (Snf7/Vps24/ESCRT-III family)
MEVENMKLSKEKLQQIIQESLREVLDDDYDENNPPAAEMMADAMEDGLLKLMPDYSKDKDMENKVHDAVMEFARELHELMNFPVIKVDPDRYFGPDDEIKEG